MIRLLLLICLFLSGVASSNELWLKISQASKASHDLNYSGIINTTDSNQDIRSTKMIHVNHEGEEFLKFEKIDGADNLLLMHEADAVIYDNDQSKILIKKKKDANLFPNIFFKVRILAGSDQTSIRIKPTVLMKIKILKRR